MTVPVYNPEISLPQSVIKGQTGFTATRLTRIVNITVGGEVRLSDKIDYGATGGLSKILIAFSDDNRKIMLNPGGYLFAGTQRFSTSYTKKKVGILDLPGFDEKKTKTVDQFKVLAYEFNCPVLLVINNFTLTTTPGYVLPQNLLQVAGHPELSEKGENSF